MMEQALDESAKSAAWHEVIPPGEAAQFEACVREMTRYQQSFARKGDGQPHRGFHVKSHAGLEAEFRVLDNLPAAARHGVFREARSFKAWVRLTNGFSSARHDCYPDLLGFAVKLRGVQGTKLMAGQEHADTQDFLALNHAYVPAADAVELMIMSMAAANPLTAPFKMARRLGVRRALQSLLWTLRWLPRRLLLRSIADEHFHGLTPMAIGPHAVKFMWHAQSPATTTPRSLRRNHLRDELKQRLTEGEIRYDFLVQFYVDERKTPIDGTFAWKPQDAPWVKLAELIIPRCDLDSAETRRTEAWLGMVSFNPWHAIAEHRPIGNVQRGRRVIYEGSAKLRGREADPVS
ncbi:hypothetical protein QTI66_15110 [Variovorax sp. J22R133]|uniref:hypothetical protein n=1 Tax=Variovorax brevis TaxID=3053503 RepID=UPI0025764E1B|nr:hypothetical protein [Variovorax sp. J22R133]MDM0113487.1 hypothetical protein [Variovorax sp. J22R133]